MNQSNQIILLEKAYTFFMVPFFYQDNEWDDIHKNKLGKWTPIKEELYNKDDVLYPYIMDLFKQGNKTNKTRLIIYEFNAEDKGPSSQLFVERVLGKKSIAVIAKNVTAQKTPSMVSFTLKKSGNFAPHIFISPSAKIGIFTFAIELESNTDIDSLKLLNYYLQKRDEVGKYQCVCLMPDKQEDIASVAEMQSAACSIPNLWKKNKWGKKECNQFNTRTNIDYVCWDINDFIDCLLDTMGKPKDGVPRLKYFSKDRIHTFTFCSLNDPQDIFSEKDIIPDLLRLSRSVIDSYMLPIDLMIQQGAILKTYDNIFFSSATEGTAMLCIAKPENRSFVDNLHNTFNRQYLIIYILVLIQRYTLLSVEQKLTEFESTGKDNSHALWNLIDVICRVKVNCYYTDVSIYSHHSQFYQHCCKNMHIQETFNEIDNKVELLKLTTNRNIQEALETQRALQQEAKEDSEHRQHILNLVVAVLTIAQVIQASHEIFCHKDEPSMLYSLIVGAVGIIIMILLMWKDIKSFFSKIFSR